MMTARHYLLHGARVGYHTDPTSKQPICLRCAKCHDQATHALVETFNEDAQEPCKVCCAYIDLAQAGLSDVGLGR